MLARTQAAMPARYSPEIRMGACPATRSRASISATFSRYACLVSSARSFSRVVRSSRYAYLAV